MLAGHITAFDQNKVDLNLFDSAVAVEGVIITQPRGGKLQARKTKLGGMLKVPHTHTHTHTHTHLHTHTKTHTLTHTHTLSSFPSLLSDLAVSHSAQPHLWCEYSSVRSVALLLWT